LQPWFDFFKNFFAIHRNFNLKISFESVVVFGVMSATLLVCDIPRKIKEAAQIFYEQSRKDT